ncbi:MAG: 4-hydroxy-3-methylbut-2-enyl diphosphate reductase [Clostridiales bacterium]|nr:4-hydroxy-3-methylbut-2-enyl diphosphate reductase [Clostridiales bacterium]
MEVIVAQNIGFCFGVKRAVDTVYEQAQTGEGIYTYGAITHNEEVVKDLENKGVHVIGSMKELEDIKEGTVIIRAHGVAKSLQEQIKGQGLKCIDMTCPFVKRIHNIVEKESSLGRQVIIVGNAGHPEVEGIVGWCMTPAIVLETLADAEKFSYDGKKELCVVSQTTYNYNKFQDIVEILKQKGYNVIVENTICNATELRQTEARKIASKVDVMIVIGGKHSSNTQKLYEICVKECENTYFIQTLADLKVDLPKSVRLVGITAGASTPNNIIEEVQNYVRINF